MSWGRPRGDFWGGIVLGTIVLAMVSPLLFMGSWYPENRGQQGGYLGIFLFCLVVLVLPAYYLAAASLLNRTAVEADADEVRCVVRPVPWSKTRTFPAKGIKQFFAVAAGAYRSGTGYAAATVYVIDANDQVHVVAKDLPTSFAANQVCHELEDFYGIEDMPVYGVTTDPSHPGPRP